MCTVVLSFAGSGRAAAPRTTAPAVPAWLAGAAGVVVGSVSARR
ncbi:hypothetical protein [Kitasatospora purpeofusca]|nr:hypothetical protein [Kitasatospora purpeofusca]MCX4690761.1 hypothetical protein [Kitasatospora purpeofusca]WSR46022.1 hypothetical protein OG196_43775 [Kitasatospora purpeofusca]